jgi:hypothetical protein
MKRKMWLLTLMLALLCGQAAWAQDMYVVAVGGVGTRINTVPYTISAPGFYYLGNNLTHTGAGTAITVNADDVTIDLMGFSLSLDGVIGTQTGILMSGRTNVEIRNGTVRGFLYGILENNLGGRHRIIGIRATNNGSAGISLGGNNNLIKGCTSSNNTTHGIIFGSGKVIGCIADNNAAGISISGQGSVLGNSASGNSTRNFYCGSGSATSILVDGNTALGFNPNYIIPGATTGVVITANNSGTP